MTNKILLIHVAVGPTYKERLLHNLNTYSSYDLFDICIMTEDVDYFSSVSYKKNIFVLNIDDLRKNHKWSMQLEIIPPVITDEAEYAKLYLDQEYIFPSLIERFVWEWDRCEEYKGFVFMNCDILPIATDESYKLLENYFHNTIDEHPIYKVDESLKDKIIVIPGGSLYDKSHHGHLQEFAEKINKKYKVTDKSIESNFPITDGNFRTFKFPDTKMIKPFFNLINNIVHEVLTNDDYFIMRKHTMWNIHAEYIYSIVFNLLGCYVFPMTDEWGFKSFFIGCYPEDRFWNWARGMDSSATNKKDFIKKNYDLLKNFYESHGQVFPY